MVVEKKVFIAFLGTNVPEMGIFGAKKVEKIFLRRPKNRSRPEPTLFSFPHMGGGVLQTPTHPLFENPLWGVHLLKNRPAPRPATTTLSPLTRGWVVAKLHTCHH